jgi:methylthioribose-1-phosphate isomerase
MKKDPSDKNLNTSVNFLKDARPTAVNLSWALGHMKRKLLNEKPLNRADVSKKLAEEISNNDIECCKKIAENGLKIILGIKKRKKNKPINILTHCNAGWLATVDWGTALSPIFLAHRKKIKIHVWVDETRPRNQGSFLTSWELLQEKIPHTIITDNAGGHIMQHGMVDMCITGSDRTTANGDVCNKIGTYLKALSAYDNKIPFYVALPSNTIDLNSKNYLKDVPIEERNSDELTYIHGINSKGKNTKIRITPKGSKARNYSFDVTPAKYITRLITEKGIHKPSKIEIKKIFS